MADKKNITLKGFYQHADVYADFFEQELNVWNYKKKRAQLDAAMKKYNNSAEAMKNADPKLYKEFVQKYRDIKVKLHDEYDHYRNYASHLVSFLGSKKKKTNPVTPTAKDLLKLMEENKSLRERNVFGHSEPSYNWTAKEPARKAMEKFSNMLLKNDYKKMQYAAALLQIENPKKKIEMLDVLRMPLPQKSRSTMVEMHQTWETQLKPLAERLKKLDDNLHVNSSEFNKMKSVMKKIEKGMTKGSLTTDQYGKLIEGLQEASMKYIEAKGVGKQSSTFGQDRMDLALDLCSVSSDLTDNFASPERRQQVAAFEKEAFGTEISQNGVFNYESSRTVEQIKADREAEMGYGMEKTMK